MSQRRCLRSAPVQGTDKRFTKHRAPPWYMRRTKMRIYGGQPGHHLHWPFASRWINAEGGSVGTLRFPAGASSFMSDSRRALLCVCWFFPLLWSFAEKETKWLVCPLKKNSFPYSLKMVIRTKSFLFWQLKIEHSAPLLQHRAHSQSPGFCVPQALFIVFASLFKWDPSGQDLRKNLTDAGQWKSLSHVCDPIDYTVHGILQARILEWVAFPFSRGSSQHRDRTQVFRILGGFFISWATRDVRGQGYLHLWQVRLLGHLINFHLKQKLGPTSRSFSIFSTALLSPCLSFSHLLLPPPSVTFPSAQDGVWMHCLSSVLLFTKNQDSTGVDLEMPMNKTPCDTVEFQDISGHMKTWN